MTEHFDVVIIGGGIHGVGVAQAAACDGYSVLVLEQTGLASATSGSSSKLIHGGSALPGGPAFFPGQGKSAGTDTAAEACS